MSTLNEIIKQLTIAAKQIRRLEAEAKTALYDHNNKGHHHKLMLEKAHILMHLPESIAQMKTSLEPKLAQSLNNQLSSYSYSAAKAVELNSVFYMSALLYPEGYTDGDNNDLEDFIFQLEIIC